MPHNPRESGLLAKITRGQNPYMMTWRERSNLLARIKAAIKAMCKKRFKKGSDGAKKLNSLYELFNTICTRYYQDNEAFCAEVDCDGEMVPGYLYKANKIGEPSSVFYVYLKNERWVAGIKKVKIPRLFYPDSDDDN